MITLYGFGEYFGVKDPSALVLKVDAYLRMAGINFNTQNTPDNLKKAPKGKLPFISDDGKVIPDSQFIIEHLKQNHVNLDSHLTPEQKAQAYLITKSLDENFYFIGVYSRWICDDTWPIIKKAFFGSLPPIIKTLVPKLIRKQMKRTLHGQGLTKHSHKEILHIAEQSFQALTDLLGDKEFLLGEQPSSLDAAAYGSLANFIQVNFENDFTTLAKSYPALVNYCANIKKKHYTK